MNRVLTVLAAAALLVACGDRAPAPDPAATATTELHALFEDSWQRTLRENPMLATRLGDLRYNDQWEDDSLDAIAARHAADIAELERLHAIDRAVLPADEKLNYDLFEKQLQDGIHGYGYRMFLIPFNQRGGIQTLHTIVENLPLRTTQHYDDWLTRLSKLDTVIDQTIALMRLGVEEGRVHPRVIMERIPGQLAVHRVDSARASPFFEPFTAYPDAIPAADRERLTAEAERVIAEVVMPAYAKLDAYFNDEYLPATREPVGAWAFPDGEAFYAWRARRYTTTELTPDEIHEIGLAEVARIRAEMDKVINQVGFKGSFNEFLVHLRTDPKYYYRTSDELFQAYLAISKRIDPLMVEVFGKLPRMPYGVRPIPEAVAPDTTTAYYSRPAADGSRAGYYYVNLYRPEVRPKYEMMALSLHEAVPGHHLQIALSQELGELPMFRRFGGFTAFTEGWGLYSEFLGEELGLYEDPYDKFGQLTYEMWRAVRLVVDTGMHHKQWTREQAIQFFLENAAKTEADIVNEIDRYIAWPGQALAYKIGELRIKELRKRAEERLGDDFDVKAFHDVVLENGAVPLDILERFVDVWIEREAG